MHEDEQYSAPQVRSLCSVEEMTQSNDKIGSIADAFTPQQPLLDGEVFED